MIRNFSFCVLAYNHEQYVIEHLESIKFLVTEFGADVCVDLIISDDGSQDDTRRVVDLWIDENSLLFNRVETIYNDCNIGTCASLENILNAVESDFCKITAGDDVYSSEDIFSFCEKYCRSDNIISGLPLRLIGRQVVVNSAEILNYLASDMIYLTDTLIERLASVSIVNAPNLFYPKSKLNEDVIGFIKNFDVVEDLPLQFAIAKNCEKTRLISTSVTLVLYRRTPGSTYIVENKRFVRDQNKMFNVLIDHFKSRGEGLRALLVRNRRACFNRNGSILGRLLNFSYYFYVGKILIKSPRIIRAMLRVSYDLDKHQSHYERVNQSAIDFLKGVQ